MDTSWQQLKSAVKVCYVRFLLKPYPLVLTCSFYFLAKVIILRLSVCMSKVCTEISEEKNLSCQKCLNSVSFIFARSLNYVRPMATWAVRSTTHAYTKLKFTRLEIRCFSCFHIYFILKLSCSYRLMEFMQRTKQSQAVRAKAREL